MAKTLTCITQEQICCIRYDLCEGQLSETYFYSIFRKLKLIGYFTVFRAVENIDLTSNTCLLFVSPFRSKKLLRPIFSWETFRKTLLLPAVNICQFKRKGNSKCFVAQWKHRSGIDETQTTLDVWDKFQRFFWYFKFWDEVCNVLSLRTPYKTFYWTGNWKLRYNFQRQLLVLQIRSQWKCVNRNLEKRDDCVKNWGDLNGKDFQIQVEVF